MKKKVAVVYGGFSSEHDISVLSGKYVASVLDRDLFDVYHVTVEHQGWRVNGEYPIDRSDFSFRKDNEKIKFDVALVLIHGTPGEDGILQSYFQLIGLPYVSCNSLGAALTFHKYYCNHYLRDRGIRISDSVILHNHDRVDTDWIVDKLGLPVFVKPDAGGSSFGTTKVKRAVDLLPAIEAARHESDEVIVEKFIPGVEVTVGVVRYNGMIRALTPCEVRSKKEFFDYDSKYNPELNEEIIPAQIPRDKLEQVREISTDIYNYLGCRGIVRIDYILGEDGNFYFLELNSVPGMTHASIVPKMLRYDKVDITLLYTQLITDVLEG